MAIQDTLLDVPGPRRARRRAPHARPPKAIGAGDIVEVDKRGRRFHALVVALEQGERPLRAQVRPLDGRMSYRRATVREVVGGSGASGAGR